MVIAGASRPAWYPTMRAGGGCGSVWAFRENGLSEAPKPRLLDRVRQALRARHLSRRTEEAYVGWIRRFIFFHEKRHPAEMGAPEVTKFLTSLAVDRQVAASTQNQALSALLFLYKDVLEIDLPWLDGIVRAKRPERLPVVLTREEVRAVLQGLDGVPRLMAGLLYGAGLRVLECCQLRVQDIDFATNQIIVRGGKGDKDRVTMLPASPRPPSRRTSTTSAPSIIVTWSREPAGSSCRPPSSGSIRTPGASGSGNGSFPPPASLGSTDGAAAPPSPARVGAAARR